MNEIIFLIHIFLVIAFLLTALRLGKNYLLALIVLQAIIANLFVLKQITLFTKTVTSTDVFIIGAIFGQNLLQEFFGKKEAIKAIKVTFFSMIFFLIMAKMHLVYFPSSLDIANNSYIAILSHSPRIILASISVFFLTQRLDVLFFGFLKILFKDQKLGLRLLMSAILIQLIDTVLFSFLGLYKIVDKIFDVMIFSFLIKFLVILTSTPFLHFAKKFLKKEKLGVE